MHIFNTRSFVPVFFLFPLTFCAFAASPCCSVGVGGGGAGAVEPIASWLQDAVFRPDSHGSRMELVPPDAGWPEKGSLAFRFELETPESTLHAVPTLQDGNQGGAFFTLPFVEARLWFSRREGRNTGGGVNFHLQTEAEETKLQQLSLSRLEGQKPYHMILSWDIPGNRVSAYLQGIEQSDLGHWRERDLPMAGPGSGDGALFGWIRAGAEGHFPVVFSDVELFDRFLTPDEAAGVAERHALTPLAGEARTVYTHGLEVDTDALELLYEIDFRQGWDGMHERELIGEDGTRVRLPEAEWVLEGALTEAGTTPDGLRLETSGPTDRQNGHWVLWNTRPFPGDFLFEYTFSLRDDREGLGIIFFNAHNPNGETLFDLDLPERAGRFREYIMGPINSYHVSPWAVDDTTLRRTANFRKNSGFMLVAIGNDVIGGSGTGPHTVRILKKDGRVQVESNGVLAVEYTDDGVSHGPAYNQPGLIGLRFMAHTGWVVLHSMKVYGVDTL